MGHGINPWTYIALPGLPDRHKMEIKLRKRGASSLSTMGSILMYAPVGGIAVSPVRYRPEILENKRCSPSVREKSWDCKLLRTCAATDHKAHTVRCVEENPSLNPVPEANWPRSALRSRTTKERKMGKERERGEGRTWEEEGGA